jgi:hypothetical protein
MLARGKNLDALRASFGQGLQQSRMQPLAQKYMGRNRSQHCAVSAELISSIIVASLLRVCVEHWFHYHLLIAPQNVNFPESGEALQ